MQLDRRSALNSALPIRRPVSTRSAEPACRLGEAADFALVQVAGWPARPAAIEPLLAGVLGTEVPVTIGQVKRHGGLRIMRTAPNQIWIFTLLIDDPTDRLMSAIPAATGCVTPLSQSRTRMFIEGARARDVLAKGLAIDLHDSVFAVDAFVLTALHHVPVLVHRESADRYELTVLRTFALTTWEWLVDAARAFDPEIVGVDRTAG